MTNSRVQRIGAKRLSLLAGLGLLALPLMAFATDNQNCTLIVPNDPLTAQGLATPYQLVATNPADGPCHEANKDQSAFVQAAVIDPLTGHISIYNPLVIDQGTAAAWPPVVPHLPQYAVVALWFGYNAGDLTLVGASPNVLTHNLCRQGFGQFAYCNAPVFFLVANVDIHLHLLSVPPLGYGKDGRLCPSVRSFAVVDQDQSDNLPTTYLVTAAGTLAQNTADNLVRFPTAKPLGNPSDNRLTDVFLDGALACTPWTAPDLANPGHTLPALPLNELQAAAYQTEPVALVPLGDPFTRSAATGGPDLGKVNAYRLGVNQPPASSLSAASTTTYCAHFSAIATNELVLDRLILTAAASPMPDVADSLFTWMAQRFSGTYDMLDCSDLLQKPDPIALVTNALGIVIDATIH